MNNEFEFIQNELLNKYKLTVINCLKQHNFTNIEFEYFKHRQQYYINCYANYNNENQQLFTYTISKFRTEGSSNLQSNIDSISNLFKDNGYYDIAEKTLILGLGQLEYDQIEQFDKKPKVYYVALTNDNQVIPESAFDNFDKANQIGLNFAGNENDYSVNEITEEKFNQLK